MNKNISLENGVVNDEYQNIDDSGHASLNLAYLRNNSNQLKPKAEVPPCSTMYAKMIVHMENGTDSYKTVNFRCKKWSCAHCCKINSRILKKRTKMALNWIYELLSSSEKGFRLEYFFKFLTLTLDGERYRSVTSKEEAEKELKKNWNKLRSAIQKRFGKFEYIWVIESQRDGYAHMHVLIIGKAIAGIEVKKYIYDMWLSYGMGFSFLKSVYGGMGGVTHYLTKYMTKELESGRKGSRVFSMSRKLKKASKVDRAVSFTVIEVGFIQRGDNGEIVHRPFYEIPGLTDYEVEKFEPDKIRDEIFKFFEEKALLD